MILNRYERTVARRYLLPGQGEGFIFLVASISLVAVALGVAALIIVMSVMNGFRAELFDKIVGLNGHAIVQGYEGRLTNWQQIADSARKLPGVTDLRSPDTTLPLRIGLVRMSCSVLPRTSTPSTRPLAEAISGCSIKGVAAVTPGVRFALSTIVCQSGRRPP